MAKIELNVDGQAHSIEADADMPLLYALRDDLGLKNPRFGCGLAQCGACTVLVNGVRINACLSLVAMHEGDEVVTIEGLANGDTLHPMQQAFLTQDALQCGYCTPGQICSAVGMLKEVTEGQPSQATGNLGGRISLTDAEIRERMSGNLCRCSAYPQILAAIRSVAGDVA